MLLVLTLSTNLVIVKNITERKLKKTCFNGNLTQSNSTLFTSRCQLLPVQQIMLRDNLWTLNRGLEIGNRNVRMRSRKNIQLSIFWSEIASVISHWCL